jgi:hypothetical protein
MDSKDYSFNDGKKDLKLTKLILNKTEWQDFIKKLSDNSIKVINTNNKFIITQDYLKHINIRKCVPLLYNNNKLFDGYGNYLSIIHGHLGNLYFRLHWALNGCQQASEFQKEIKTTPENIFSEFIKWWSAIKTSKKISNFITISKINDNKFRINDLAGFLSQSVDYELKSEIKDENSYDDFHIKFILPWTIATELSLYLSNKNIVSSTDENGYIIIKR